VPVAAMAESHYDAAYFAWQAEIGRFGAEVDAFKFRPFVASTDRLLDFGCGAGDMIVALHPGEAIGVELSAHAREAARSKGLATVERLDEVGDGWADVAISHHALEHVEHPLKELTHLTRKLRRGGRLVVVVPCDVASFPYRADDQDLHLYSWSAGNLGNLARSAGLEVIEACEIAHKWPPAWRQARRWLGPKGFHLASLAWGRISLARRQVRVVAERR